MNPAFQFVVTTLAASLLWALPAHADSRYQPNAAGDEITDTQTGLIWRRCAEGQSWSGSTCTGKVVMYTWDGALARAQSQATNSGVAWRLPNDKELSSLANRSLFVPAIDTTAFPGATGAWFWSSTPQAGNAANAWGVYFDDGYTRSDTREGGGGARLVRSSK